MLFAQREVLVYQVPPAASSAGHKADDWKKCIFKGPCRVMSKGNDLSIRLFDASSGNLFAECQIPGGDHRKYVEPVTDSSRFFVLKITNGKRHAYIGLGFEERNDAFDFKCTLNDFKSTGKQNSTDNQLAEMCKSSKDLSLKEGQTITIKLKGMSQSQTCSSREQGKSQSKQADDSSCFGILLPPPKHATQMEIPKQPTPPQMNPGQGLQAVNFDGMSMAHWSSDIDSFADFGDFIGFQSNTTLSRQVSPSAIPQSKVEQTVKPLSPEAFVMQQFSVEQPLQPSEQRQPDVLDIASLGSNAQPESTMVTLQSPIQSLSQTMEQSVIRQPMQHYDAFDSLNIGDGLTDKILDPFAELNCLKQQQLPIMT